MEVQSRLSAIKTTLFSEPTTLIVTFIIVVIVIVGLYLIASKLSTLSSKPTVDAVTAARLQVLNKRLQHLQGTQKSIYTTSLPDNQNLLINYQVAGCRLAGYLGPLQDGVYKEEDAVRLALAAGNRLFVLEISALEENPTEPLLVARDSGGYKRALNDGSIKKVCSALASTGCTGYITDPLIIVLYFHDAPSVTKNPSGYIEYLSKVAKALQPLIPHHLGLTNVGNFTRQGMESSLFSYSSDFYKNKVIIMTNANTTYFRDPTQIGINRKIPQNQDLDFFVHARIYKQASGGDLGITEIAPAGRSPRAIITDDAYFLTTPPDRIGETINLTRNTFTIVMKKDPTYIPTAEHATLLLSTYGISCIPTDSFDDSGKGLLKEFTKNLFIAKPITLRFTKPASIVPSVPNPALDARGGNLVAPSL
jgi:hypothetical protein